MIHRLQVSTDATDADIQRALDNVFQQQHQTTPDSLSVAVGSTPADQSSDQAPAQLLVTRTTVDIANDLRVSMRTQLEQEPPYREIIAELEDAPIGQQEVKRGVEVYRFKHGTLAIHCPDFHEEDYY